MPMGRWAAPRLSFAAEAVKQECSMESCSTSSGSNSPCGGESAQIASKYSLASLDSGLPDYEYPVPVIVRNTFIDTLDGRPVSLDEFFTERRINSCPVEPRLKSDVTDDVVADEVDPQRLSQAVNMGAMAAASAANSVLAAVRTFVGGQPGGAVPPRHILTLSDALPMPDAGGAPCASEVLPSVGSAGHECGACQPCAFFHKQGCASGAECSFCHLCGPGEKKKRQKAKIAALREARQRNTDGMMVHL